VPVTVHGQNRKLSRESGLLFQSLGREPTLEEIAAAAEFEVDHAAEIIRHSAPVTSLNRLVGSDNVTGDVEFGDLLPSQSVEEEVMPAVISEAVLGALACLDDPGEAPVNAEIVKRRFGISPYEEQSVRGIARELGIPEKKVKERITLSLARLAVQHGAELKELRAS
jgi:DNA-directed RNA polymerase sigma subunit (sigma70/sigma32)